MEFAVIALLVIIAAAALYKLQTRPKKSRPPSRVKKPVKKTGSRTTTSKSAYPAVSIQFASGACAAVKSIRGQRFLAPDAPTIPLENCGASSCTCKYIHHPVRREHGEDRRAPSALQTSLYENSGQPERREAGRRRSSDPR